MKIAYAVAALGASFLGGFFLMVKITPKCTPQIQIKTVTSEKQVEHVVTRISKPDGTVIVRDSEWKLDKKENLSRIQSPPTLAQFRVGVGVQSGLDLKNSTEVSAGYRIKGPIWIDTGYNIQKKEIRAGVSVEF